MWWFKKKDNTIDHVRDEAFSIKVYRKQSVLPEYTVETAVKEGLLSNPLVYRCIDIKASNISRIPFAVYQDGKELDNHPVTRLFKNPSPQFSYQTMMSLLVKWMELTGNAYIKTIDVGTKNILHLINPDKISPIVDSELDSWIIGYGSGAGNTTKNPDTVIYQPEEIIHIKYPDPANPAIGISPLRAGQDTINTSVAAKQLLFDIMKDKGNFDAIISFKGDMPSKDFATKAADALQDRLNAGNRFAAIADADFKPIKQSVKDMSLSENLVTVEKQIATVFGIPLPLLFDDRATFNNYQVAELILWNGTLIPILDVFANAFTNGFKDVNQDNGEYVGYSLYGVQALRRAYMDRVNSARKLTDLGVPMVQVNELLDLNLKAYEGWDEPYRVIREQQKRQQTNIDNKQDDQDQDGAHKSDEDDEDGARPVGFIAGQDDDSDSEQETRSLIHVTSRFRLAQVRADVEPYQARASNYVQEIVNLLDSAQEYLIYNLSFDSQTMGDIMHDFFLRKPFVDAITKIYRTEGIYYGRSVLDGGVRVEMDDDITKLVDAHLQSEGTILRECSLIADSTASSIIDVISQAIDDGWSINELQERLIDVTAFKPDRALRIARTITGSASSLGSFLGADEAGANFKTWVTSGNATVRQGHQNRENETVPMKKKFSLQYGTVRPRWPLDINIAVIDRVNCRCAMDFTYEQD